jgi:hypothetical protein
MSVAAGAHLEPTRRAAVTEKAYRFGAAVTDELNGHPGTRRLPTIQFALLMGGLAVLLLLLYAQIIW